MSQPKADERTAPDSLVQVEWSLTRDRDALRLEYSVKNVSSEQIHIADQLPQTRPGGLSVAKDRVVVSPVAGDPETVRLSRGLVEVDSEVAAEIAPGVTHLDPGQTHTGSATIPLPLKAWHNYAPPDPLPAVPERAILEIGVLTGEGDWGSLPLGDGSTLTVPQLGYWFREHKWARGDAKPIP